MTDLFDDPVRFLSRLILQIPALLVAVTVHELAHALVADRLGDPTPRRLGRITLNPLPHIDPLGALAFVLAGFGWAKPVPVSAQYLRRPIRDMALVAAAGPLSNFLVAFVALVAVRMLPHAGGAMPFVSEPLSGALFWTYVYNLALGIFNLIPLPPLDGGHFLPYLFPRASWSLIHQLEQVGPLLLILLVLSGATRYIVQPVFNAVSGFYLSVARLMV
ncbi:MAG TPA: site-2 protease family protein [Methylomirabilota bacterium]|jgi:Zn-dependent protease|nr:site-2 protease family protein [Methylomirabilota bacterium]